MSAWWQPREHAVWWQTRACLLQGYSTQLHSCPHAQCADAQASLPSQPQRVETLASLYSAISRSNTVLTKWFCIFSLHRFMQNCSREFVRSPLSSCSLHHMAMGSRVRVRVRGRPSEQLLLPSHGWGSAAYGRGLVQPRRPCNQLLWQGYRYNYNLRSGRMQACFAIDLTVTL